MAEGSPSNLALHAVCFCYHDYTMIRTQVQLSEEQVARLKRRAALAERSMADLIREAVDLLLARSPERSRRDQMRHVASAFGRFASGTSDLGTSHDQHFTDAVAPRR